MQPTPTGSEVKRSRQVPSRYLSAGTSQPTDGTTTPRSMSGWVNSASVNLPTMQATPVYVNTQQLPAAKSRSMGPPSSIQNHAMSTGKQASRAAAATPRMARAISSDIIPQPDTSRRAAAPSRPAAAPGAAAAAAGSGKGDASVRQGEAFISPGSSRSGSSMAVTPAASKAWGAPVTPRQYITTSMAVTPRGSGQHTAHKRLVVSMDPTGLQQQTSTSKAVVAASAERRAQLEAWRREKAEGGFKRPAVRSTAGSMGPPSIASSAASSRQQQQPLTGRASGVGAHARHRQTILLSPGPSGKAMEPTAFTATAAARAQQQQQQQQQKETRPAAAATDSAFTVTMAALKETGSGSKARPQGRPRQQPSPGSGSRNRPRPGSSGSSSTPVRQASAVAGGSLSGQPSKSPPAARVLQLASPGQTGQQQQQQQQQAARPGVTGSPPHHTAAAAAAAAPVLVTPLSSVRTQSRLVGTPQSASRIPRLNLGAATPQQQPAATAAGSASAAAPLTSRSVAAAAALPLPDQGDISWEAAQVPLPDATPRRMSLPAVFGGLAPPPSQLPRTPLAAPGSAGPASHSKGALTPRHHAQQQQQQQLASSGRPPSSLHTPRQHGAPSSARHHGVYARAAPGGVAAAAAAVLARTPRGTREPTAAAAVGSGSAASCGRPPLTPRGANPALAASRLSGNTATREQQPAAAAAAAPKAAPGRTTLPTPRGTTGWSYPVPGSARAPSIASAGATSSSIGGTMCSSSTSGIPPGRLLDAKREQQEALSALVQERRLSSCQLLLWAHLNARLQAALDSRQQQAESSCAGVAVAVAALQSRTSSLALQLQQARFRCHLAEACSQQLPALRVWAAEQGEHEQRLSAIREALGGALSRVPLVRGATLAGSGNQPDSPALLRALQCGQALLEGLAPAVQLLLGRAAQKQQQAVSAASTHAGGPSAAAPTSSSMGPVSGGGGGVHEGGGVAVTAAAAVELVGCAKEEVRVLLEVQQLLARLSEVQLYSNSLAVQLTQMKGAAGS